jgi:hypothetical protein
LITKAIKIICGMIIPIVIAVIFVAYQARVYVTKRIAEKKDLVSAVLTTKTASSLSTVDIDNGWVFEWSLPVGQTLLGYNTHHVDMEITRNDKQEFWAVLYDSSSGVKVKVGGLRLGKTPQDDMIGAWSNYLDGDNGQCFLYKKDGYWSGHHYLRDGRKIDCKIRRK